MRRRPVTPNGSNFQPKGVSPRGFGKMRCGAARSPRTAATSSRRASALGVSAKCDAAPPGRPERQQHPAEGRKPSGFRQNAMRRRPVAPNGSNIQPKGVSPRGFGKMRCGAARSPRTAATSSPRASAWTATRSGLTTRKVTRVLIRGGPEHITLPRVFEREGRRFAGEGCPAVPQPQALPAGREARRRPSRSRSAAGG